MTKDISRLRGSHTLLDYVLEQPRLVDEIQRVDSRALVKLVDDVGLEDAGEIVALATTAQLEGVFDEDLWKSEAPGKDERFDAERFSLWVEILVEQGAGFAARKLVELDEDLVTLGLCKHLFVIDIEQLAQRMSSASRSFEDDALDKQLESGLYHEFEQYRVISRSQRGWDAILAVLVELNAHDFETLSRLLGRCCDISMEYIEDNGGLYHVLTSEQVVESDAATEREERREAIGYVPPSAALSFLKLTLATPLEDLMAQSEFDPITRAHFRVARPEPNTARASAETNRETARLRRLLERLSDDGTRPGANHTKPLLTERAIEAELVLSRALARLRERVPAAYTARALELAYLANLLLSGCGTREGRLRPVEAAKTALAVSNSGAEYLLGASIKSESKRVTQLETQLREIDLVKLFRIGLKLLCRSDPDSAAVEQDELVQLRMLLQRQGLVPF